MINRLVGILLLLSILSCKEKMSPFINGHWVQVDDSYLRIVDIEDSILWVNKNSLTQTYSTKSRILFERDSVFISVGNYPSSYYILVRNDTLIFAGEQFEEAHFVKKKVDLEFELFSDLEVSIELNEANNVDCYDSVDRSFFAFLSLGKGRRFRQDTATLQVADTFIDLDDIPLFIDQQKLRNDKGTKSLMVVLSVDKSISQDVVNEVIKSVKTYDPKLRIVYPMIDKVKNRVCYSDSLYE